MKQNNQKRGNNLTGLLTSVYHGDLGVAGLLWLKHRTLCGGSTMVFQENTWAFFSNKHIDNRVSIYFICAIN